MDYWITKLLHIPLIFVCAFSQEVFNTMPPPVNTNFTCRGRDTGFYADVDTNCRVYHTCDDHGNKFTYHCPAETAFRQEALVCDHAHLVDCAKGRRVSLSSEDNGGNEGKASPRSSGVESSSSESGSSGGRSIDVFHPVNSNPSYTRSFRITAEPPSQIPTAKAQGKKQPTFVLNSSVFLRDRVNRQKASPSSQENRVATESSRNSEGTDNREENTGSFTRKFSSATSTTTFKPFHAGFENPTDRFFGQLGKKEENEGFVSRGFSSPSSTTTLRPFGAGFKVNYENPMDSRPSKIDKKLDEKLGFFGRQSTSISTSTFRPFRTDFKVDPNGQKPSEYQHRNSNRRDESVNRFSSTTFRPFGADFKQPGGSGDLPSFGKVKYDKEDGNTGSKLPAGGFGREEMSPGKGFRLEEKSRNYEKGDRDFSSEGRNNDGSSVFEGEGKNSASRSFQGFTKNNERPSSFFDNSHFPYSETLRSMQARTDKSSLPNSSTAKPFVTKPTYAPTTTAGTEFPVHPFTGSLSPLVPNELEDDPYYPKRSTTTEAYYKLSDNEKGAKGHFRFSTRRPWPGSLDFEIPEVLPDFNTLDDLVDRRKLFFIPRVKAT